MKAGAIISVALTLLAATAPAQWDIQDSHTTASLRGIDNVGSGVAWASGTNGTILRTEDGGYVWQLCAIPPGAEKFDFRGIQAFDANTAIVMSSGKGDLSRLYKTTDGCQTWKLVFTNPDKDGFWDAIRFDSKPIKPDNYGPHDRCFGVLLGDPVDGRFPHFLSFDCGNHWERQIRQSPDAQIGEGVFAASNSSLQVESMGSRTFVTGGPSGPRILYLGIGPEGCLSGPPDPQKVMPGSPAFRFVSGHWNVDKLPLASSSNTSGAFSIASGSGQTVVVGGNFEHPNNGAAWYVTPSYPFGFKLAQTPPHGYRSAVAYDAQQKLWITVGPNGTDISTDDGRNWRSLKPSPTDPPDADKNWNALSLPFVVGPNGRIGKLRPINLNDHPPKKE